MYYYGDARIPLILNHRLYRGRNACKLCIFYQHSATYVYKKLYMYGQTNLPASLKEKAVAMTRQKQILSGAMTARTRSSRTMNVTSLYYHGDARIHPVFEPHNKLLSK